MLTPIYCLHSEAASLLMYTCQCTQNVSVFTYRYNTLYIVQIHVQDSITQAVSLSVSAHTSASSPIDCIMYSSGVPFPYDS